MTHRPRPEPRPVFVLTLRVEPYVADATRALRRGLKYLLRACGLRAISAVELHPDPAKAADESESLAANTLMSEFRHDITGGSQ
jgi:hypothetical protein